MREFNNYILVGLTARIFGPASLKKSDVKSEAQQKKP